MSDYVSDDDDDDGSGPSDMLSRLCNLVNSTNMNANSPPPPTHHRDDGDDEEEQDDTDAIYRTSQRRRLNNSSSASSSSDDNVSESPTDEGSTSTEATTTNHTILSSSSTSLQGGQQQQPRLVFSVPNSRNSSDTGSLSESMSVGSRGGGGGGHGHNSNAGAMVPSTQFLEEQSAYVAALSEKINPSAMILHPIDDQMSDDDLIDTLDDWFQTWCPRNCSRTMLFSHIDHLYGPVFTENALKAKHIKFTRQLCQMKREFIVRNMLKDGEEDASEISEQLTIIGSAMFDAHDIVLKQQRMILSHDPRTRAQLPKDETLHSYYQPSDPTSQTSYKRLLLFLLDQCAHYQFTKRADGEYLYRPRFADGDTGPFTFSYKKDLPFTVFVQRSVFPKEMYQQQWDWLHDSQRNGSASAKFLSETFDYQLPFIEKDRHILSFRNGVYMLEQDVFLSYDNEPHQIKLREIMGNGEVRKVAAKFHDMMFYESDYHEQMKVPGKKKLDWYQLETPVFQSILDYQEFDEDVCRWVYVFYGRMFYYVGELDNWQIQLFTRGVAGSGKSTSLRHLARVFDKEDVGILGNNIQPDFAVESIADCFFYMALDINKDFKLDQTMWQSMVSGEEVSISRKHRMALIKIWTSPGMLVGNVTPRWSDNADSVARRIALLDFQKVVRSGDPRLFEKLYDELAAFIKKCNMAYLLATRMHGDKDIWKVLPEYFKQKRKQLRSQTNCLSAFLQESGEVTLRPHVWMKMEDFTKMFQEYCHEHKKPVEDMTEEYYSAIFQHMGLKVKKGERMRESCNDENSSEVYSTWIMNVCDASLFSGSDDPWNDPAEQHAPNEQQQDEDEAADDLAFEIIHPSDADEMSE